MCDSEEKRKSGGYTYWKREIPDAHLLPSSEPQKLAHSPSEESLSKTASSGLVSAWNAGTTYEEKDITARARKSFEEAVCMAPFEGRTVSVEKFDGEVHAVHVRGKVRIGYEIHSLELKVGEDTVKVKDLDSTDPEGFQVSGPAEFKKYITQITTAVVNKLLTSE